MDFTWGQYAQLIVALAGGIILFALASFARVNYVVALLVLTLPFQIITSRYGTINMVLIYLVFMALLFRGKIRAFPLISYVVLIFIAYFISLALAPRGTFLDHGLYLIGIAGSFLLFYIVYNHVQQARDTGFVVNLSIGVALLVNLYCLVSLALGFDRLVLFGIQELAIGGNLEEKQRLVGPFDSPGTNAEFLALQVPLLGFFLMHERRRWKRWALVGLILSSFGFLVATGSRGGFIVLLMGAVFCLFAFRKKLGLKGVLVSGGITAALVLVALIVVQFTQFNVMFTRLSETEITGLVPETRAQAFEIALERIPEQWLAGHGPNIRLIDEDKRQVPGYVPLGGYPHNLYLYLLYTVGVGGLSAYLLLFGAFIWRFWRARRRRQAETLAGGIPTLALILTAMFLVSQYRIEFLRDLLYDYQNYLFALWAMLLAISDGLGRGSSAQAFPSKARNAGGGISRQAGEGVSH